MKMTMTQFGGETGLAKDRFVVEKEALVLDEKELKKSGRKTKRTKGKCNQQSKYTLRKDDSKIRQQKRAVFRRSLGVKN